MAKELDSRNYETYAFSSQEFTAMAIKNLHRRVKLSFIENGEIITHPSQIYWKLDENNLLVRAFHLHPLLVWPENKEILPNQPIDGPNYLGAACPDLNNWEVVRNTKTIAVYEFTPHNPFQDSFRMPLNKLRFQKWGMLNLSSWNSFFGLQSIILGDGKAKPHWKKIEDEASHLIDYLLKKDLSYYRPLSKLTS